MTAETNVRGFDPLKSASAAARPRKPGFAREGDASPAEVTIAFEDNRHASSLFGSHDQNLAFLERRLGVEATVRGNHVAIRGPAEACQQAKKVLDSLYDRVRRGEQVALGDVDGAIRMTLSQGQLFPTDGDAPRPGFAQVSTRKKTIVARTAAQDAYIRALGRHELCFATGPAGTGKTYIAVAWAAALIERGEADRIILSRPAVEAGERLGFLPGDMKEKVDPYLRPIYDALYDTLPAEQVERRIASGEIEIAPLAFMRGRTLANAFIVLDEAQNTTIAQMKMFLTRFGEGSRMVVCGDPKQVDLPQPGVSGLADAVARLQGVDGIAMVPFGIGDVVRHPVVGRIVQAYEGPDA